MGARAGLYISTGTGNTAIGKDALISTTGNRITGDSNTAVGMNAGYNIQGAGATNTLVGKDCGKNITTGTSNTAVGFLQDLLQELHLLESKILPWVLMQDILFKVMATKTLLWVIVQVIILRQETIIFF